MLKLLIEKLAGQSNILFYLQGCEGDLEMLCLFKNKTWEQLVQNV